LSALVHNMCMTDKPTSFHRRLHSKTHIVKSFKERADANRTFTERSADFITDQLGSMLFLTLNLVWFALWIGINIGLLPIIPAFDPSFNILTMIVSLEAIFLSVIVLISQNRAARIDDFREEIALHIDTIAEEEITKMIELQLMILKKHGVDVSKDPEILEMLEPNNEAKVEKSLEEHLLK
jgi:uncharacterized membrane protein